MNLEKALKNYGLTEKQAKVYLACLELGSATVTKIAQKAGLPRSTCYEILEVLRGEGTVSTFQKKKVKYFSAENPEKAISIAKQRVELLEQALPQLRALYGDARIRPTVRLYQGRLGMKIILEEILEEAKELLAFSSAEDLFVTLEDEFPEFVKKRIKQKILAKVILRESAKAQERKRLGPSELREVRIIPESFKYHGAIFIWRSKIAMFSFKKDLVALVVESEELANVQKAMFDFIWESLSK